MTTLHSLVLSLVLAMIAIPAPAVAAQGQSDEDQTELGQRMEEINSAWRQLRRQVNDSAKNTASLELVAKIREAGAGTERMVPARAGSLPEAERAKFQADYAAGMKKFFDQIDSLEAALRAGDNAAAGKLVASISSFQRESHREFRKDAKKE